MDEEIQFNCRTVADLKKAFEKANEAISRFYERNKDYPSYAKMKGLSVNIYTSGEARSLMENIREIEEKRDKTSTYAGAGGAVTSFFATTVGTAPVLGPLSLFAGIGAALLAAKGVSSVTKDSYFDEIRKQHGQDIIDSAVGCYSQGSGHYKLYAGVGSSGDGSPDYGPSA